ncbi:hypothetical protein CGLAUT_06455 [Corynebacterium glaucum]|uniref:hypothetical protein n=1 Tax=Corynebacterium glaucum TaxID=187491 RepID=UPI0025B3BCEE|nr:hypothetical protein [Corynebacterium glaucum]WJZ07779.1 hypothetical protein CGLAUT_06455 [Corynebacterium glaucum]
MHDEYPHYPNYPDYPDYPGDYRRPIKATNRIDIVFERDDDACEHGLTIEATADGPEIIAGVLEAVSLHDITTADAAQGTREVLARCKSSLEHIALFHGPGDPPPDDYLGSGPEVRSGNSFDDPVVWYLRLDFAGGEIAIKHSDGPAVLRGPFDAAIAKQLSTTFFTELTEALEHLAPTAASGNVRVIHERDGDKISGTTVHIPMNGTDALSGVLGWIKDTDRYIMAEPAQATSGIVQACRGIDPVVVPFRLEDDTHSDDSLPFSNDCPIVVVDCVEKMIRLHAADGTIEAEQKLHKTGAAQIRRALHQQFRERGVSLAPDYHNRYGWQRDLAIAAPF